LIDTGVEPERLQTMTTVIRETAGVVDAHDVRTRLMGSNIYLDGHVLVDPKVSVSEGHRIGEAVRYRLKQEFDEITDITIHIDSEDDESYQLSDKLPLRNELKERFLEKLADIPQAQGIRRITFHYLNGHIHAELWLPLLLFESLEQATQVAAQIRHRLSQEDNVAKVDVLFS
jgi:divalent metal cation (Fe/Co/Zn/Cd) transporter